jgi:hypothetical protein
MDDRLVEKFFGSLEGLDPLDAWLPRDIQRVRRRWSKADAHHLPGLLSRLQKALEMGYAAKAHPDCQSIAAETDSQTVAFLCLEAICAIQRRPECVPPVIRSCLRERDHSLRAKALAYVCRAERVDRLSIACVKSVMRDGNASISNRLLATWVLWKKKDLCSSTSLRRNAE